jgi:hypothetical protein
MEKSWPFPVAGSTTAVFAFDRAALFLKIDYNNSTRDNDILSIEVAWRIVGSLASRPSLPVMQLNLFNVAVSIGVWLLCQATMSADSVSVGTPDDQVAAVSQDSEQMARRIDAVMEQAWDADHLKPAPLTSDGEFLRRAYLDLNGVIPRAAEVRAFLSDERPEKRVELVDRLLASPRYATHMATIWRNRILPPGVDASRGPEAMALQKWLRTRFAKNLRYDNLVGELLITLGGDELGPALYFQANDLSPEKLAASSAELFLGLQLQCAQCHDHPTAHWKQKDFWGLAAFFARVNAREGSGEMRMAYRLVDTDKGDVRLPDSTEIVAPKYPAGDVSTEEGQRSRRVQLVLWMTSRENDFFARAAVNWAWTQLFGRGLVESLDDVQTTAESRLLNDLASYFVQSGYDLRKLWRTLAITRVYQLSSRAPGPVTEQPQHFARMVAKPLTPEQLYDSFSILASLEGKKPTQGDTQPSNGASGLYESPSRLEFIHRMRSPRGSLTEYRSGTLQALMLMNGRTMADITAPGQSNLLGALDAPFMKDEDRVEALFLATLARRPEKDESTACVAALRECSDNHTRNQTLGSILWALLNGTEFAFNQ